MTVRVWCACGWCARMCACVRVCEVGSISHTWCTKLCLVRGTPAGGAFPLPLSGSSPLPPPWAIGTPDLLHALTGRFSAAQNVLVSALIKLNIPLQEMNKSLQLSCVCFGVDPGGIQGPHPGPENLDFLCAWCRNKRSLFACRVNLRLGLWGGGSPGQLLHTSLLCFITRLIAWRQLVCVCVCVCVCM